MYPVYRNDEPLEGWHRVVVGTKAMFWPPLDATEHRGRRPMQTPGEVQAWLAQCNQTHLIDSFDFEATPSLAEDKMTKDVKARAVAPFSKTARCWIDKALGYPIARHFEYIDAERFHFTHGPYLKTLRRSVVDDIQRQCRDQQARQLSAREVWRKELRICRQCREDSFLPSFSDAGIWLLSRVYATQTKLQCLRATSVFTDQNLLLREAVSGAAYVMPSLLSVDMVDRLLVAATRFRSNVGRAARLDASLTADPPRTVALEKMGLSDLADKLLHVVVRPLAARLFPGDLLDSHVAFVNFSDDDDPDLEGDDAEATFEVPLHVFEGADLFHGLTTAPLFPPVNLNRGPPGSGFLFGPGARRSPSAMSLVLWCRSSKYRTLLGTADDGDFFPLDDNSDEGEINFVVETK